MDRKEFAELAWPKGDKPEPDFDKGIKGRLNKKLTDIFNCLIMEKVVSMSSLVPNDNSLAGRFLVVTEKNIFFMRITKRLGEPDLEKKLLSYLESINSPVNPIIISQIVEIESSVFRVDIRPYIEARFYNDSSEDIFQLGRGLGIIHDKIQGFPEIKKIERISTSRYKKLNSVREKIINKDSLIDPYLDMVNSNQTFFDEYGKKFDPLFYQKNGARLLHGEIHPGNVLFLEDNNLACFIDFEEAVHTYAPVSWDIGFSVQRFILRDAPESNIAKKRLEVFEKGYGKKLPAFFSTMEDILFYSITIIFDLLSIDLHTPESEFMKFMKLYNDIQKYKAVIN